MAFQFVLEDPAKAFSAPPNLSTPLASPPRLLLPPSASNFSRPFAAAYKHYDQVPWPPMNPSHSLESSLPYAHSLPRSGPHPLRPTSYPSSYLTFFDSLKPKPAPSISYDLNCESSQLSFLASPGRCTQNVEDVLMQPPPSGNPLFSSPQASRNGGSSSSTPLRLPDSTVSRIPSPPYTINFPGVHTPPPLPPKRKERPEIDPLDSPRPLGQLPTRLKPSLTITEKLEKLFDFLKHDLDWTLSELLYHTFAHKDADHDHIPRSHRHGNIVQRFLSRRTTHCVSGIIHSWLTSPDGRSASDDQLFNVDMPFLQITPVREALTAFAAQSCSDRLAKEVRIAVDKASGLHAHVSSIAMEDGVNRWLGWPYSRGGALASVAR